MFPKSLLVTSALCTFIPTAPAQLAFSLATGDTLAEPGFDAWPETPAAHYHNARDVAEPFAYWVPAVGSAPDDDVSRPAVLVVPGGGYYVLAYEKEGLEIARRLAAAGLHAAVLMPRLPTAEPEATPYPRTVALDDGRAALAWLRAGADRLGVDTARLSVMGFSAGGHLAMLLSTLGDVGERPAASVLVYPVVSMVAPWSHGGSRDALLGPEADAALRARFSGERRVDAGTPPTYLVHAADDAGVPVRNSLAYATALDSAGVPFALRVLPEGGHGFGLWGAGDGGAWLEGVVEWLTSTQTTPSPAPATTP